MLENEPLKLRWEHSEKLRYYVVHLEQDLFGEWCLVKSWGGLRQGRGNVKTEPCDSYEQGLVELAILEKRREARGYRAIFLKT